MWPIIEFDYPDQKPHPTQCVNYPRGVCTAFLSVWDHEEKPLKSTPKLASTSYFTVYTNAEAPSNHFSASGFMGDLGDVKINENCTHTFHSSPSSIEVTYDPQGLPDDQGNHICSMGVTSTHICKWAGVYWLEPADNWGQICGVGYDLTEFSKLAFWARSNEPVIIMFKVGGVGWGTQTQPPCPDSLRRPRHSGWVSLGPEWTRIEIGLEDADLSYIIGGFVWVSNWDVNEVSPGHPPLVFYLDDIRFEQ